jgi:hypothetical protein
MGHTAGIPPVRAQDTSTLQLYESLHALQERMRGSGEAERDARRGLSVGRLGPALHSLRVGVLRRRRLAPALAVLIAAAAMLGAHAAEPHTHHPGAGTTAAGALVAPAARADWGSIAPVAPGR